MARGDDCCYLCNECPNSFATLDELESHMSQDHLAKKCAVQGPSFVKQEFFDEESEMKMDLVSGILLLNKTLYDFQLRLKCHPGSVFFCLCRF